MTETEWIACDKPALMLEFLQAKISSRKLRLFGCATCRRIWHLLPERSREAVEMAELYADGLTTTEQFETARIAAHDAWHSALTSDYTGPLIQAEEAATRAAYKLTDDMTGDSGSVNTVIEIADSAIDAAAYANLDDLAEDGFAPSDIARPIADAIRQVERAKQSVLLRDIMGNPFQPVAVEPSWLAWNDGWILKRAQEIYAQRGFEQLAGLACMLERAGCDQSILRHCNRVGKHVLGCWLVDLLLGKE